MRDVAAVFFEGFHGLEAVGSVVQVNHRVVRSDRQGLVVRGKLDLADPPFAGLDVFEDTEVFDIENDDPALGVLFLRAGAPFLGIVPHANRDFGAVVGVTARPRGTIEKLPPLHCLLRHVPDPNHTKAVRPQDVKVATTKPPPMQAQIKAQRAKLKHRS